jgi:hypothetical protein
LATRQRELVDALEALEFVRRGELKEARRVEARAREDAVDAGGRVGDEAARRMT